MSELLIIEPIDLAFGAGDGPRLLSVSDGSGGANLVTYDPREIWRLVNPGQADFIDVDLGADMQFDTVYLGNTNAEPLSSLWAIRTGTQAQGASVTIRMDGLQMVMPVEDQREPRGPSLFISPNMITARYLRINVFKPTFPQLEIGNLIIGKAYRPFYNKERGAQRVPFDSGTRTRLSDGSLSTVSGRLISGFKWVFGDLSEAETKALWGIIRRRRTTEPVVLIEDADNLSAESTHYCTLTDLQPYTRLDPRKTRWELSAEDWR